MTDQNSQFFAILTAVGEAKQANANALGVPWTFAQMGVGDANNTEPVPSRTQTKLINERRRAALNQISVDPKNSNIIIAEQVIPPDEGGWWIREIGLYDAAGDLVAVANCAPSFKPLLSQGTGKTQVVRLNLIVTSTANVQLKIDPAVVLATREYVDSSILNVLPKNKVAGTYTKVRINDRGVVQEGSNPTTLAGYGITDAMPKGAGGLLTQVSAVGGRLSAIPETRFVATLPTTEDRPAGVNYAAGVHVTWGGGEQCIDFLGALNGQEEFFVRTCSLGVGTFRKLWTEANFTPALKANLASPTFTGTPRVPNAAAGTATDQAASTKFVADALIGKLDVTDAKMTGVPTCSTANLGTSSFQVANTEFVQNTINNLVGSAPENLNTLSELAAALGKDPSFSTTMLNLLAAKAPLASPALSGAPTATTPVQFDVSTRIASTEFVQKALGNLTGEPTVLGANTVLTAAQAGGLFIVGGADQTTLPALSSVPAGSAFHFLFTGSGATLKGSGAEGIQGITGSNQYLPLIGEKVTLVKRSNAWYLAGGGLGAEAFLCSMGFSGYQKFPSGLILQWGNTAAATGADQTHTLPIAFPNSFRKIFITQGYTAGSGSLGYASAGVSTLGAFIWRGSTIGNGSQFFALGS